MIKWAAKSLELPMVPLASMFSRPFSSFANIRALTKD